MRCSDLDNQQKDAYNGMKILFNKLCLKDSTFRKGKQKELSSLFTSRTNKSDKKNG